MMLRHRRSIIFIIIFVMVLGAAVPTNVQGTEAAKGAEEKGAAVEEEDKSKEENDKKENDIVVEEKKEEVKETDTGTEEDEPEMTDAAVEEKDDPETADAAAVTVPVPIYNYDIASVLIPTSYSVALNPYELPIKTKDGKVSSAQVVSQNYGIVNKSTRDKVVTATFTLKDENAGKIVFVGSKEEALKADKNTYAVYLAVVPADSTGIKVEGADADKDTSAEALSDVAMNKAGDHAVVLSEEESQISFKLSKAVYEFGDGEEIVLDSEEDADKRPKLAGLAENSGGVTAFTFDGVMNPKADWSKLKKGVKISVTYDYDNATGDEKIVGGTGAMIER